jgi:hypothetical protein
MSQDTDRIRALNDQLRQSLPAGNAVMTLGIAALSSDAVRRLVQTIATFVVGRTTGAAFYRSSPQTAPLLAPGSIAQAATNSGDRNSELFPNSRRQILLISTLLSNSQRIDRI